MLFLGGRRELVAPTLAEAVGDGVDVDMMSSVLGDCIGQFGKLESPIRCGRTLELCKMLCTTMLRGLFLKVMEGAESRVKQMTMNECSDEKW